jgi:hypothetical protein
LGATWWWAATTMFAAIRLLSVADYSGLV